VDELARRVLPFLERAGYRVEWSRLLAIVPLIQERITRLSDAVEVADFFFLDELRPYDPAELVPPKGDAALAEAVLRRARQVLAEVEFRREALESALRAEAEAMGVKAGVFFQPVRVACCGRKAAPPLFETLEVLGRETCLKRIGRALELLGKPTAG